MSKVIFDYNQEKFPINCNENERMKDICKRLADKININLSNLYFMYSGTIIQLELPYKKVISSSDSKKKCFTVLVNKINEDEDTKINNNDNFIKAKQIKCAICPEIALCEIVNNKIILSCKYGHRKDLTIGEFENSQKIDQSKIVCELCKKNNKANTYENKFFRCMKCKKDICPLCKDSHVKNEPSNNIIDYDQKKFYCETHGEEYYSYCKNCSMNLCPQCETSHNNHQIISWGKILIDQKELKNKLYSYKNTKDEYIKSIKDIVRRLNQLIDNAEKLYKINEDMVNEYLKASANRNYELLMNLRHFNTNNKILDNMNQIINEKNLINKIEKLLGIKNEEILLPLFTIRSNCNENKCIDSKSSNYGESAQIWDYQRNNKNQIFELVRGTKEGFYSIRNHYSGFYLGVDLTVGDWVITFKKKSETCQNFKLIDCKNGFYILQEENNYAIDLANFNTQNGSYVGFTHKNGSKAQLWKLVLI